MKKQLIIIGIIVILLAVGLSGCEDKSSSETNYLSVFEVCEHPNKYLDAPDNRQTVTIKGYYYEDSWGTSFKAVVNDMNQHVYGYAIQLMGSVEQFTVVKGGLYLFEGRLYENDQAVFKDYMPLEFIVYNITAV